LENHARSGARRERERERERERKEKRRALYSGKKTKKKRSIRLAEGGGGAPEWENGAFGALK
jgi:hypothetical protein